MTIIDTATRTLAARLRISRLLAGLEQQQIADELGVARTTVSTWETGKTEPSATNFVRWAQLTGQTLDWFAEGVGVRPKGFEPPTFCSVVAKADREARCFYCGSDRHDTDDCPVAPSEFVAGRSQACANGDHDDCLGACSCWCHDHDWLDLIVAESYELAA